MKAEDVKKLSVYFNLVSKLFYRLQPLIDVKFKWNFQVFKNSLTMNNFVCEVKPLLIPKTPLDVPRCRCVLRNFINLEKKT